MPKKYIRCAIDHGTTNSAIATFDGDEVVVIQPSALKDYLPSVVYITAVGRVFVGQDAYRAMLEGKPGEGNGHFRFKPTLGQNERYDFPASRRNHSDVDLAKFVISNLLAAYETQEGERPRAAVITVPAVFEDNAEQATKDAARDAGLSHVVTIQEPIAAALAYGFEVRDTRANWLVFDLGGGTLDVSLVVVRDGKPVVPEHGHAGDNTLGGGRFDELLEEFVLSRMGNNVERLRATSLGAGAEHDVIRTPARGSLRLAVETAKIELSDKPEARVKLPWKLEKVGDDGADVDVDVTITREEYERLIGPDVEKAVRVCERLIEDNHLDPKDVQRLILVGGPSKTPYVQRELRRRLGIPFETRIETNNAVVRGAALHAAVQEDPTADPTDEREEGAYRLTLEYAKDSAAVWQSVTGRVTGPHVEAGGFVIEFARSDGNWSDTFEVGDLGHFEASVLLRDEGVPRPSRFTTVIRNGESRIVHTSDELEIWYPYFSVDVPTRHSFRVAEQGDVSTALVAAGSVIPTRGRDDFVTTRALIAGDASTEVRIPILNGVRHLLGGEDERPDCHVRVATLRINGAMVAADVPRGSRITVTIYVEESERRANALIELTGDDFDVKLTREDFDIKPEGVSDRFTFERSRLTKVRELEARESIPKVASFLEKDVDRTQLVQGIERDIERARRGEGIALKAAYLHTLEVAGALNVIWEWQRPIRVRAKVEEMTLLCSESEAAELGVIEAELELALASGDAAHLARVEESIDQLDYRIRRSAYWDLLIDVEALGGLRVNSYQHELHERARRDVQDVESRGGTSTLTAADIEHFRALHRKIGEAYPDLDRHRKELLDRIGKTADDTEDPTIRHANR